jgi:hypothetical protein
MPFKEDRCAIIYPGHNQCPTFYTTGVNVVAECRVGVVTFRKDPTGIILHKDKCKIHDSESCLFCRNFQGNLLFNSDTQAAVVRHIQERMLASLKVPKELLLGGDDEL